jgi:hypothetical protein
MASVLRLRFLDIAWLPLEFKEGLLSSSWHSHTSLDHSKWTKNEIWGWKVGGVESIFFKHFASSTCLFSPIYYLLSFLYSSRKYFKPPHGAPIASKIISKGQESKNIWINILLLAWVWWRRYLPYLSTWQAFEKMFDDPTWGLVMTQHMLARILKVVSYVTKDTSNSNIPLNPLKFLSSITIFINFYFIFLSITNNMLLKHESYMFCKQQAFGNGD